MLTTDFVAAIRKLIAAPPIVTTTFYVVQKKKVRLMTVSKGKEMKLVDPEAWMDDVNES